MTSELPAAFAPSMESALPNPPSMSLFMGPILVSMWLDVPPVSVDI